jgi:TM2 domain-containing membrane protein YozV
MNKRFRIVCLLLLLLGACHRAPKDIEPHVNYALQDKYLKQLPKPFAPLSAIEREQSWGKEYLIGISFARKLDLYQAITAFKRAEILADNASKERQLEMQYEILLCYYYGQKYNDVIEAFETSDLESVDKKFPAFHDLLLILYDSYSQVGEEEKARRTLSLIKLYYPEEEEKIELSTSLLNADFPALERFAEEPKYEYIKDFLTEYKAEKKSVSNAQTFNALLPGAGYFYVGQPQAGITALLLNGLFIAATYQFFHRGDIAAGIVFASFEAGWYFGGIYGVGLEAKYYNERLYEKKATPFMNQKGLFPVFMLQYSF